MKRLSQAVAVSALSLFCAACPTKTDPAGVAHEQHDDHDDHDEHPGRAGSHKDAKSSAGNDGHEEGLVTLSPGAAARVRIRTAQVDHRSLSGLLATTGRVDFDQDRLAHVSPRVSGRVSKVQAKLGEDVRAGQTLAVIDSIELGQAKSAFLRAKAQLGLAKSTLEREEALLQDRITSEQSVLEARAASQRAMAEFQAARQQLRLLGLQDRQINSVSYDDPAAALFSLSSPISGTIVEKHASLGEVVSPQRTVYTVADLSRLWIWIDIYERDLSHVHLEDDVAVRVDASRERTFEGKVAYIRDQVDPDTRTARARIDVANPDRSLRAGMFATVTVSDPHGADGEAAPRTLVVPASAVQRDGEVDVVFVPKGERRFARQVVRLGRRTDAYVEVLDGLAASDSVVTEGTFLLKSEAAKESMGGGHSH